MKRKYTKPADSKENRPKTAGEVIIENLKKGECIITMYPDLDYAPNPDMGKFSEFFKNSLYFDHYLWWAFNRKDPYDDMMNRMNDYFRKLTGDDTVGISLSDRPMLYFNPRAKTYINYYYALW